MIHSSEMDYSFRIPTVDILGRYTSPISINFDEDVLETIRNLRRLTSNWDGYGADTICSEVIENTISLFEVLSYSHRYAIDKDDITPLSHGTISLEWFNDQGDSFAVEIGKTTIAYFSPTHSQLSIDPQSITPMLDRANEINNALDTLFA